MLVNEMLYAYSKSDMKERLQVLLMAFQKRLIRGQNSYDKKVYQLQATTRLKQKQKENDSIRSDILKEAYLYRNGFEKKRNQLSKMK